MLFIIGVTCAIVIPVMLHSKQDEKVLKFKKADNEIHRVIDELITSDKYYCNGDLGLRKPDCKLLIQSDNGKSTGNGLPDNLIYLCKTMSELLSTKSINCKYEKTTEVRGSALLSTGTTNVRPESTEENGTNYTMEVTEQTIETTKELFDIQCKNAAPIIGAEITTTDGTVFYQTRPFATFGFISNKGYRAFSSPYDHPATYGDKGGFDINFKNLCIDIDGIPDNATATDCVNECPFGYGVRADGKIMRGKRAEEWIEKTQQKN